MIYQNLITNKDIWTKLEKMFHSNRMPHALLFYGSEGSGKEAHAIELASLLIYKTKKDLEKIKLFQHPNIHLITPLIKDKTISKNTNAINALTAKSLDEYIEMKKQKMLNPYQKIKFKKKSTILINSIRDIKKNIHLNSQKNYNVYLIFEADKLCYPRNEAGNSLLKILEEPPVNTIFILVTSHKEKILDTMLSRCCDFYFSKLDTNTITNYLEENNYQIEQKKILIQLCDNNLNLIIELIEQSIDLKLLIDKGQELINNIINDVKLQECHQFIETLFKNNKKEFKLYIKIIIIILNDLNKMNTQYGNLNILNKQTNVKELNYAHCIKIVEKYYHQLENNLNPTIGFFAMIIEIKKTLENETIEQDYMLNG